MNKLITTSVKNVLKDYTMLQQKITFQRMKFKLMSMLYYFAIRIVIVISMLLLGGAYMAEGCEFKCQDKTIKLPLINKFEVPPKNAHGTIVYCNQAEGQFKANLSLNNLSPQTSYLLTINGIPDFPGNDKLKNKKVVKRQKIIRDFATLER